MAATKKGREINQTAEDINTLLNNMYIDVHKSNPTNLLDLDGIKIKAYDTLKTLTQNNIDSTGTGAFSQIINRVSGSGGGAQGSTGDIKNLKKTLNNFFDDSSAGDIASAFLNTNSESRLIREYDAEIDAICEYMPILSEAIEAKKDSVLSADQFSKDFIFLKNKSNPDETKDRLDRLKKSYNLLDIAEDAFDDTCKYGEYVLYVAPYNEKIKELLNKKKKSQVNLKANESAILESYNKTFKRLGSIHETFITDDYNIELDVNYTGYIDSAFEEQNSLSEATDIINKFSSIISEATTKTTDGLLDTSTVAQIKSIPGAIVKKLDRANIVPLMIGNDINGCIGYYYFEGDKGYLTSGGNINAITMGKTGSLNKNLANSSVNKFTNTGSLGNQPINKDSILKDIAKKISDRITPKFIVKNQDLKYDIYNILKYTMDDDVTNIKVTFIPAEYIEMNTFSRDENGRGESMLAKSLIPAKLYIGLYTANTIGILTRGFDKRLYYVKNTVDTNISQTLISTINAIKASNKGLRDYNAIANIINSSGIANDLLIPTNKNGESPIEFSIMEGQNIDTKESLMEQLEHMAISPTGVPYEYLLSRKSVDYAIRLTMANGKFLKDCYKIQSKFEKWLTRVVTKIYNYEYLANDEIEAKLPPPAYLAILNTQQMLDNVKNMIENIVDICNTDEETPDYTIKTTKRILAEHYLSGYIDFDTIDKAFDKARVMTSPANSDNDEPEE